MSEDNVQDVNVVGINITFGNIVKLTFKFMVASILVGGLPMFIIINLTLDALAGRM